MLLKHQAGVLSLPESGECRDRQMAIGGGGGGGAEKDGLAELAVANTSKVCQLALEMRSAPGLRKPTPSAQPSSRHLFT